ncbi:hypothetical protein acsn021_17420 [Anaerocolumna cellulosilytica]|uniref:Uncharacterized protein n=1 Tax=Anaerocolumna cellulosilytica TaxID=433286 RepID=A0A6S6QS58_9FIRM|nr:hypothetical protein [Anaerocolumna cellulosilytica]MBB5194864.1 hypothetical protein [Anaerocolumna cellulosilytica]BCJ94173.1 hypothetical protein acsn021_17420 [Anaerocolumna cellulosilytica]
MSDYSSAQNKIGALPCFYANLKHLLEMHEIVLTEADIYFLCGYFSPESIDNESKYRLKYPSYAVQLHNFCMRTYIDCEMNFDENSNYISSEINQDLFQDRKVLLAVDAKVLDHLIIQSYARNCHFLISTGLNPKSHICVSDFFVIDREGKVNTYVGEYQYNCIKDALYGYIYMKNIDKNLVDKAVNNMVDYVVQELERLLYKTEDGSLSGLGLLESLLNRIGKESYEDSFIEKESFYNLIMILISRHIIFFDYICDFMNQYQVKDGENMTQKFMKIKNSWDKITNMMAIQTFAYNYKRNKAISYEAGELIKQQQNLLLQLITNLRGDRI